MKINDRHHHAAFLARQKRYERKFAVEALALLARQYRRYADSLERGAPQPIKASEYSGLLTALYDDIMPIEAAKAWDTFVAPLTAGADSPEAKSFLDRLMSSLSGSSPTLAEWVRIWRSAARDFVNVVLVPRMHAMAITTNNVLNRIIREETAEGTSIDKIAGRIREEATGPVNVNRSMLIARTETIAAMNRGKRLSMYSSGMEWEKKWLATPDKRTRDSHADIGDQPYRHMDAPYWLVNNEGSLEEGMYPGDPDFSVENVANCRCTETYRVIRDASGAPKLRDAEDGERFAQIVANII